MGLFASILLLGKSSPTRRGFRWLAAYLIIFTLFSLHGWMMATGHIAAYPYLLGTTIPLYFLPPVLGFVYMRSVVVPHYRWKKSEVLHFLPTLLCLIDLSPFYLSEPGAKMEQLSRSLAGQSSLVLEENSFTGFQFYLPAMLATGLYYLLFTGSLLARFKQKLDESATEEGRGMFSWLGIFTALFFIFWLGNSLDFISRHHVNGEVLNNAKNAGTSLSLIVTVILLALFCRPINLYYRNQFHPATAEKRRNKGIL
jgi:hypothetical protein